MSNVIDLQDKNKDENFVDSISNEYFENPKESDALDLEMIKRGIKSGLSMLDKAIETHEMPQEISTTISCVQKVLQNTHELVNLLEHDLVGMLKNMEAQAAGQWTTQAHLQTLIETLKQNSVVTNEELEATWNKLIPPMMKDLQDQA